MADLCRNFFYKHICIIIMTMYKTSPRPSPKERVRWNERSEQIKRLDAWEYFAALICNRGTEPQISRD